MEGERDLGDGGGGLVSGGKRWGWESRDIYWKGREWVERKAAEPKGGEKKQNLSLLLFFPQVFFSIGDAFSLRL